VALAETISAKKRLEAMGVAPTAEHLVQFSAQGDGIIVDLLLQSGLTVNSYEALRMVSPLHNAAAQGHTRLVNMFLERGANVNATDWHGNTPLMNAAYFGRLDISKILITKGAEVNAMSKQGQTALVAAIYSGNQELVAYLLSQGANPELGEPEPSLVIAERSGKNKIIELIRSQLLDKNK
jgi:ankyrin repeat protein